MSITIVHPKLMRNVILFHLPVTEYKSHPSRGTESSAYDDPSSSFRLTSAEGFGPGRPDKAHDAWPESRHLVLHAVPRTGVTWLMPR